MVLPKSSDYFGDFVVGKQSIVADLQTAQIGGAKFVLFVENHTLQRKMIENSKFLCYSYIQKELETIPIPKNLGGKIP